MSDLKTDHEYLYKRVRLKAVLHIILGLVLILFPLDTTPQTGAVSTVQQYIGSTLTWFGVGYVVIGSLIAIGLFKSKGNYRWARASMTIACIYNTIWLIMLVLILFQRTTRSIAYITTLYGYLAYNLWYVRYDPGWKAIEFVKEIREGTDDGGASTSDKSALQ